jgi:hypothetical protein
MSILRRTIPQIEQLPLPGNTVSYPKLAGINTAEVCDYDRTHSWYEPTYHVGNPELPRPQTAKTVVELLTHPMLEFKNLAEYAAKFNAFFLITVARQPDQTDTWTVMPAFDDQKMWKGNVTSRYAAYLENSWAHIIVDPGESAASTYKDSEQLGIKDSYCGQGMLAFDVCREDIRWDRYDMARSTLVMEEAGWVDWRGNSLGSYETDFTGPATEVKQLGRFAITQ